MPQKKYTDRELMRLLDVDKKIVLGDCYAEDLKSLAGNVYFAAQLVKKHPATA